MVCFSSLLQQTETLFDFSWLCGSADDVTSDSTSVRMTNAGFVQNVWSHLEYEETSISDKSNGNSVESRGGSDGEDDGYDFPKNCEADRASESILSCQDPQERGSNIPILRQLPSFGSTLRSSSLQSGIFPSYSGLSSYPTRSSSTESVTKNKQPHPFKKPLGYAGGEEETPVNVRTEFYNTPTTKSNPASSGTFIFLKQ